MARPKAPVSRARAAKPSQPQAALTQAVFEQAAFEQVSGNPISGLVQASSSVYRQGRSPKNRQDDRHQIAQQWQIEAYRHVNICGEARFAVTYSAALGSRAEIGVSEPQSLGGKAQWVTSGPEVEAFAELAPTVRDRTRLLRNYLLHRNIAGEMYLIARDRHEQDPEYSTRPHDPVWEIVAVTELIKTGSGEDQVWKVRLDNNLYVPLSKHDPIIRIWNPDPENRREAWSPMRSLLPTLREIEWLTGHIFTQVRSRLMSAGVWFLPENLTFPPPPADMVEGGEERIAAMSEPERFMMSLAASGQYELDLDEVSFPTVVMADADALAAIDKNKLIQFWSEIDDKAMTLRTDAIRRFALGWDLPPEQVLGSSGVAISGSGGSAGCVDMETEALTKRGWVHGDDLRVGDEVLTLNHETGVSEWQPVERMNRFMVTDEPMLRMHGVGHDSLTTLNHRWAVLDREGRRKFVTSDALNQAHRIPTAAPHVDFPTEAKYSDAFVELVAWWWTEGCHSGATESRANEPYVDSLGRVYANGHPGKTGRFNQAGITQSRERNPERVDSIRRALDTAFPGGWGFEHQRQTQTGYGAPVVEFRFRREVWEALHEVAPNKVISLDFIYSLTRAQIELFIQTSCAGDGWHYRDGRLDIWQRDPGVLDAYEVALILSGRMVAESEHAGGKVVNAYRKSTVHPFHAAASPGSRMVIEEESYTGMVWCPTVENSTWLARRGGTVWFTGNSVNHWGEWASEEKTIAGHVEPALSDFVEVLTTSFLRAAVEGTDKVIAYDPTSIRMKQDRSKQAIELYDRGLLKPETTVREVGFDPQFDMMDDKEFRRWLLVKMLGGSPTPEMMLEAAKLLGQVIDVDLGESGGEASGTPGRALPRSLDEHPVQGPPEGDHEHNPAPYRVDSLAFTPLHASAEGLVLRALEKAGNRLLNDGKRGRDRDRSTPPHLAHLTASVEVSPEFDFSLLPTILGDLSAGRQARIGGALHRYCTRLYTEGEPYTRESLIEAMEGL